MASDSIQWQRRTSLPHDFHSDGFTNPVVFENNILIAAHTPSGHMDGIFQYNSISDKWTARILYPPSPMSSRRRSFQTTNGGSAAVDPRTKKMYIYDPELDRLYAFDLSVNKHESTAVIQGHHHEDSLLIIANGTLHLFLYSKNETVCHCVWDNKACDFRKIKLIGGATEVTEYQMVYLHHQSSLMCMGTFEFVTGYHKSVNRSVLFEYKLNHQNWIQMPLEVPNTNQALSRSGLVTAWNDRFVFFIGGENAEYLYPRKQTGETWVTPTLNISAHHNIYVYDVVAQRIYQSDVQAPCLWGSAVAIRTCEVCNVMI